jgi:arsenate reductase
MSTEPSARRGYLFVCVANSARSQMAEGFARELLPPEVGVWSAGSRPSHLNPLAVQVMTEVGIDISRHVSKGVDDVPRERVGTVVTLCAEEECPLLPGDARRLHWPLPDPAAADGDLEERLATFRTVRDEIARRVASMLARPRRRKTRRLDTAQRLERPEASW